MFSALRDREARGTPKRHAVASLGCPRSFVQHLRLERALGDEETGHTGCVNTVSFTPDGGRHLISGSDDRYVIFWDWQSGKVALRYPSGHSGNVFQARAVPETANGTVITCAADGAVRVGYIPQGSRVVETHGLHKHAGRAHKLAIDPTSPPCFLSCGEDGSVVHYDLRERAGGARLLLTCRPPEDLARESAGGRRRTTYVGLNAIMYDPTHPYHFAVGGDDSRALVYDIRTTAMKAAGRGSAAGEAAAAGPSSTAGAAAEPAGPSGDPGGSMGEDEGEDEGVDFLLRNPLLGMGGGGPGPRYPGGGGGRPQVDPVDPVRSLRPSHLRHVSPSPHITCVVYSKRGELLVTYNEENIYSFGPPGTAPPPRAQGTGATPAGGQTEALRRLKRLRSTGDGNGMGSDDEDDGMPGSAGKYARGLEDDLVDDPPGTPGGAAAPGRTPGTAGPSYVPLRRTSFATPEEPWDHVLACYKGHRNSRTVKGVNFMGPEDDFVVSGSDCGHIFVWDRKTSELLQMQRGDQDVVNCIEPHPTLPCVLAASGIDDSVKVFGPSSEAPTFDARRAAAQMKRNAEDEGPWRDLMLRRALQRMHPEVFAQLFSGADEDDEEGEEGGEEDEAETEDEGGGGEGEDAMPGEGGEGSGRPERRSRRLMVRGGRGGRGGREECSIM